MLCFLPTFSPLFIFNLVESQKEEVFLRVMFEVTMRKQRVVSLERRRVMNWNMKREKAEESRKKEHEIN